MQTGLPMAGLAVVGGPWKLKREHRRLLSQVYLPWALRAAANAERLICIHYEQHLDKPLEARGGARRLRPAVGRADQTADACCGGGAQVVRALWRVMPAPALTEAQLAGIQTKRGGGGDDTATRAPAAR